MNHKRIVLTALLSMFVSAAAAAQIPPLFITADRCIACHNGLVTPQGEDVSIGTDWRSSMMAHSARDPYWQAAIRRETLVHPTAKAAIEHECSACHMPMMRYMAKVAGEKGEVFTHLPIIRRSTEEDLLAADGVSCSVCHQIQKDKLGEKESFTAGFIVDTKTPLGQRKIFGPFEVDEGRQALMQSSSQFLPSQAAHIQSSEFCASCHTLYTLALDEKGEVIGEFPEQVPYLEWKHSSYANSNSCQSCHMPEVEDEIPVSGVVGKKREQVSRHVFRGGNFFIPRILNRHRDELGVDALPQEMDTTFRRTTEHLQSSAAKMAIKGVEIMNGSLHAEVSIQNLAGHKLPSAYPSRRVWIHFTVQDGDGSLIFESGRMEADGSISGNDNDADRDRYEPHYAEIDSPGKVQIYESILAGSNKELTTVLLTANHYAKDNRLLPEGFDKATAEEDIAVHGAAESDKDFRAGGDSVTYRVPLRDSEGPFKVKAELWYQPISYRWAHNLEQEEAEEIDRFVSYYNAFSSSSGLMLVQAETIAK
jgi:nitrate/TMAO reductase-like tetraheme cytochrome c subunit